MTICLNSRLTSSKLQAIPEEVIDPKTGKFYPERDNDGRSIKNRGATYTISDIYRLRRADGSELPYAYGWLMGLVTIIFYISDASVLQIY